MSFLETMLGSSEVHQVCYFRISRRIFLCILAREIIRISVGRRILDYQVCLVSKVG